MTQNMDIRLRQWLQQLAKKWGWTIEQVTLRLGAEEINNRELVYPKISEALCSDPIDLDRFVEAVHESWVLGFRFDAVRFNQFVQKEDEATEVLKGLVTNYPVDETNANNRINDFIEQAIGLGYKTPKGGADRAGAALLASTILSSIQPDRYVDFRRSRWEEFAKYFGTELTTPQASYGELLTWAGNFGRTFTKTSMFQQYWAGRKALWVLSGLCWIGPSPEKPEGDPPDIDSLTFPEGATKRRLHLLRERNQTVVNQAKSLGIGRDPFLRCEVCGFSFIQVYGELGRNYIEAHHKLPVAELKPGSRTRVEDIALICPNCHRMLHRGEKTLTLEELREVIQQI